jgi:hypothetical protein
VGAVTKGLRFGMTASTEPDRCPASKAESFAILVNYLKVAFDADGTVVTNTNLCGCHSFPPNGKYAGKIRPLDC